MSKFLTSRQFNRLLKDAPTFDDFLQNVANFAIERFAKISRNPPEGRIEALLDAIIDSDFESKHFLPLKASLGV